MANSVIIKDLIDKLGLNVSKFERAINAGASTISKAISRNSEIKLDIVEKIITAYPQVNKQWLLTGNGEMFIDPEKPQRKVPMMGEAAAGADMQIYTNETQEVEYIDVGDMMRDSEAAFTVYGNSMTPNYPSGCVLGVKRNYDGFIQPGETYLLITKSNRVFKRLYYLEDGTGYECVSDNAMMHEVGQKKGKFMYPIFPVKFDDVISVYDVIGMIRRNRNSGLIERQK